MAFLGQLEVFFLSLAKMQILYYIGNQFIIKFYSFYDSPYNNVYIISPLENGKTRARNLFEIRNHGDEMQIDFLRNTRFQVEKIEQIKETEHKKIYLKELGSES